MTVAARDAADRLHSELVRARARCERCGTVAQPFECAHIVRRRYGLVRHRLDNAWCLCHPCHRTVDLDAFAHLDLVKRTIGTAALVELRRQAHRTDIRPDWPETLAGLREIRDMMRSQGLVP